MVGRLLIDRGPDAGRSFPIGRGEVLTLGRGEAAACRLSDPHVSRIHCELRAEPGGVRVVDLGSTTGTRVKGQNITEHLIQFGEAFFVGKTRLRLEAAGKDSVSRSQAGIDTVSTALGGVFEVGDEVARGQTGIVHRGTDLRNGKAVAIKFLHGSSTDSDEQVGRFVRAMTTVVTLRHPNLISVHGAGRSGPRYWIAMEFVPGENLTAVIDRIGAANMLDWRIALRVAAQVARGLQAAHARGIVHRNIAPRNILIRRTDEAVKLGDLMLAKAIEGLNEGSVTRPGELVGSIAYMAPERTLDESGSDTRADLYALGATLYALLTGRPPFEGRSLADTLRQIRNVTPRPPREVHLAVPDLLQAAVLKLLAKRPDDRYATAELLLSDLERIARYHNLNIDGIG
ncbi:MAG: FHA domain-containing serine/threonine-protein kinase [Isosphaeraceae bacterium]